jgi:hypothetical protein
MATSSQHQGLSKYVTLISSDGFEFVVLREAACISGAIKRMLDPKSEPPHATHLRPIHQAWKSNSSNLQAASQSLQQVDVTS